MSQPCLCATVWVAMLLPLQVEAQPLSMQRALELAVQRSEAARSARASVRSATEAARAAGQLPDPTLRIGVDNVPVTGGDRFSTTRDSMTMQRIGISQEWLSRDKRAARQVAADALVGREAVQTLVAEADARLQTALAYVDAFFTGEALRLTTLMEHHVGEEYEAARARLASATGAGEEVLRLRAAKGLAEDESAELRQQQSAARLALQRRVGTLPDELDPIEAFALPSQAEYIAGDPAVAALQRDIEVARGAVAVATSNRTPSWTWEVAYGRRTGYSDMVSVGVTVPLPLAPQARQDRDTAAKLASVDKAEAELAEAIRAAQAEHLSLTSDAERLQDRIERYRAAVLAPAQQRTAAATAAYGSNQASLTTLFGARQAEVEIRRKLLILQHELAKRHARLTYRPIRAGAAR